MKLPVLFAYLTESHQRRHGPSGYLNYSDFKPWLRDEFVFRCVYCLEREQWYPDRFASFSVDHVIPQSKNKNLVNVYENLVYACTRCNSARQDVTLLDPTKQALGNHLKLGEEGMLEGLTEEGLRLIERLQLNENPALKNRPSASDLSTSPNPSIAFVDWHKRHTHTTEELA